MITSSDLLPLLLPLGLAFFKAELKFYWLAIRERGKLKDWQTRNPSRLQQIQSEGTERWQTIRVNYWIIDLSRQDNGVYVEYFSQGGVIAKGKIPWDRWASLLKRDPVLAPAMSHSGD